MSYYESYTIDYTISSQANNGQPQQQQLPAAAAQQKKTTADVIPKSWGNVGGLAIDLDDLSLAGRNQKKNAVPMNAMMKTSPSSGGSSGQSPMSPSRPTGPFPGPQQQQPPPLQPPAGTSGDLLNDLL